MSEDHLRDAHMLFLWICTGMPLFPLDESVHTQQLFRLPRSATVNVLLQHHLVSVSVCNVRLAVCPSPKAAAFPNSCVANGNLQVGCLVVPQKHSDDFHRHFIIAWATIVEDKGRAAMQRFSRLPKATQGSERRAVVHKCSHSLPF
jgi:hypothetical protein